MRTPPSEIDPLLWALFVAAVVAALFVYGPEVVAAVMIGATFGAVVLPRLLK